MFVETNIYKSDLTTYQPSFCTHWKEFHHSFIYYISLCNFHLHLPICPLSPYIFPIQISTSIQFCTLFPWTYTDTFCFQYYWSLFPLLVIPGSLLFSHITTKTFSPPSYIFLTSIISIHLKLLLWKDIPLFTLINQSTNSTLCSGNISLHDICIISWFGVPFTENKEYTKPWKWIFYHE